MSELSGQLVEDSRLSEFDQRLEELFPPDPDVDPELSELQRELLKVALNGMREKTLEIMSLSKAIPHDQRYQYAMNKWCSKACTLLNAVMCEVQREVPHPEKVRRLISMIEEGNLKARKLSEYLINKQKTQKLFGVIVLE